MSNNKIKVAWDKLNPNEENIQRILTKIHDDKNRRKGFSRKVLFIAAAITALTITTVFANSNALIETIFGNSRAVQVDEVINPNITRYVYHYVNDRLIGTSILDSYYFRVSNPDSETREIASQRGDIYTVKEANRYAPFTIAEPTYIPQHLHLWQILLPRYYDDAYACGATLIYTNELDILALMLHQRYVGPDGYFVFESVHPIEKVMVDGVEALLVEEPTGGANPEQMSRQLMWISDGIFFKLMNNEAYDIEGNWLGLDLETMIAIAESIR